MSARPRTRPNFARARAVIAAAVTGPAAAFFAVTAFAAAVAPPPGDPWAARDHFTPRGAAPAHPGTRLAAAVTSWEALDGDLRTTLRLAHEPEGWGFSLGWRRYWLVGTADADDLEALAVVRSPRARLAAGAGLLRRGARRVERWVVSGDAQVFGPLVAGARAAVFPAEANWAPEVTAGLAAAWGPWWGAVELGPRSGDLGLSVGLRARPDLAWTSTWAGDHPRLGLAWGWGGAELRASQAAHPRLGSVQSVAVVAGGLKP